MLTLMAASGGSASVAICRPAVAFFSTNIVSVICADSGLADGLSTALFCMSYEDGLALTESLEGVEVLWVRQNGERLTTPGFDNILVK